RAFAFSGRSLLPCWPSPALMRATRQRDPDRWALVGGTGVAASCRSAQRSDRSDRAALPCAPSAEVVTSIARIRAAKASVSRPVLISDRSLLRNRGSRSLQEGIYGHRPQVLFCPQAHRHGSLLRFAL